MGDWLNWNLARFWVSSWNFLIPPCSRLISFKLHYSIQTNTRTCLCNPQSIITATHKMFQRLVKTPSATGAGEHSCPLSKVLWAVGTTGANSAFGLGLKQKQNLSEIALVTRIKHSWSGTRGVGHVALINLNELHCSVRAFS